MGVLIAYGLGMGGFYITPLVIWSLMLLVLSGNKGARVTIFERRGLLLMGARSYSMYICHWVILWFVNTVVMGRLLGGLGFKMGTPTYWLVVLSVTIPLVLVFSAWLHRTIELPCMRYGKIINFKAEVAR